MAFSVKSIVRTARAKALQAVNFAMVEAYGLIGKRIVEEEPGAGAIWKTACRCGVPRAAPNAGIGVAEGSIRNFRHFILPIYPSEKILYALSRESR